MYTLQFCWEDSASLVYVVTDGRVCTVLTNLARLGITEMPFTRPGKFENFYIFVQDTGKFGNFMVVVNR